MDAEHVQSASSVVRWQARMATTLVAWLAAFLVVTLMHRLFGDQLVSLPLELRALVLSGVLVGLMANVVMPAVNSVVARWLATKRRPGSLAREESAAAGGVHVPGRLIRRADGG